MAARPTRVPGRPNCGSPRTARRSTVTFDNGESFALDAEYLRVMSPSAEVQGHSPDERKTVPGKRNVAILEVHPIGNYAVRLVFDDMHSTGIYSWDYLLRAWPQPRAQVAGLSRRAGRQGAQRAIRRSGTEPLSARAIARSPWCRSATRS